MTPLLITLLSQSLVACLCQPFVVSNDDGTYVSADDLQLRIVDNNVTYDSSNDMYYNYNVSGLWQIYNVTNNETLLSVTIDDYANRNSANRELLHNAANSPSSPMRGQVVVMSTLAYHLSRIGGLSDEDIVHDQQTKDEL